MSAKLGFVHAKRLAREEIDEEPLNYYVLKGSSEISSNNLWKSKINMSYSKLVNSKVSIYANFNAGYLKPIGSRTAEQKVKVNDAFYLPNFKGIRNVGYFYDIEGKKEGLCGDILGFDRYI